LEKIRNAIKAIFAYGAQSQVRARVVVDNVVFYKLGNDFRGNIAIANTRAIRFNYIDQGFSIAQPNAANLHHHRWDTPPGYFLFNRRQNR